MSPLMLELSDKECMRIEAILMDNDAEEALLFVKDVIKPKVRARGSTTLDTHKSTGVMT